MMNARFFGVGAAASLVLVSAVGCGAAADKLAEKGTERALEMSAGGDLDIDLRGGEGMTIRGPDGEVMNFDIDGENVSISGSDGDSTFSSGTSTELPEDWPRALRLPDAQVVSASRTTDGEISHVMVMMQTGGSVSDSVAALRSNLESDGYEVTGDSNMNDGGNEMAGFTAEKGAELVNVRSHSSEGEPTTVTVSLMNDPT